MRDTQIAEGPSSVLSVYRISTTKMVLRQTYRPRAYQMGTFFGGHLYLRGTRNFSEGDNFPFRMVHGSRGESSERFLHSPENRVNGALGIALWLGRYREWPMESTEHRAESFFEGGEVRTRKKGTTAAALARWVLSRHKCAIVASSRASPIVGLFSLTPLTTFYLKFVPKWRGPSWQIFLLKFTTRFSDASSHIMPVNVGSLSKRLVRRHCRVDWPSFYILYTYAPGKACIATDFHFFFILAVLPEIGLRQRKIRR